MIVADWEERCYRIMWAVGTSEGVYYEGMWPLPRPIREEIFAGYEEWRKNNPDEKLLQEIGR